MDAYEPLSLRVIVVPNVASFFIPLVLNYQGKSNTHFINTHSPSSHCTHLGLLCVLPVISLAMASPTIVKNANLIFDVQCGLISDILIHKGHEHQLFLSNRTYEQNCSSCDSKSYQVFPCITCEFALDFKCATLPHSTRYKQHEHSFTLSYTVEDDSGEYYCDICEEERDPKHWFYYCEDCSYPAHRVCILGNPNVNFGGAYTFDCHPHPLTFIEETKDCPQCHECSNPCNEIFFQCTQCDFNMHFNCL